MYGSDFDVLDPNPLATVLFIDLKSEAFVQHQSVIEDSGLHESSVMRGIARAPVFIQLESDETLTGVMIVAWSGRGMAYVSSSTQSCTKGTLVPIT